MQNDLFEEWKRGNETAFEQLFNQLFPLLLKFAVKMLRDEELAEEIVMDVFFKIWNKKDDIDIQGNVKEYLYKCVKHGVIDYFRKKKPAFQPISDVNTQTYVQASCGERLLNKELELQYGYAIKQLSPKRRQVYELSRMEGMSYKEIASSTGLSLNTVENHISAALHFLRSYLKKADITLALLIYLTLF